MLISIIVLIAALTLIIYGIYCQVKSLKRNHTYTPLYRTIPYTTGLALERVQSLKDIPGFIAILVCLHEDDLFFSHKGFNLPEIKRSIISTLKNRRPKGGSSITQQLVKNVFVLAKFSFLRKPLEVIYTVVAEQILTKEDIFILYLDNLRLGDEVDIGWIQTVEKYLNKNSSNLSLSEALFLINLIPNPSIRLNHIIQSGNVDRFTYTHIYGRLFDFIRFVYSKWGPLSLNSLHSISYEDAICELKTYKSFKHDIFNASQQAIFGIRVDFEMSILRKTLEDFAIKNSNESRSDSLIDLINSLD